MLSLALTKVKLKLPENFGEATELLAMLCTTQFVISKLPFASFQSKS